ncbi:MAG TPA: NAD(P)H-dependent oxidoreductase [Flavobacterium sp.]|jgi:nitroreductase
MTAILESLNWRYATKKYNPLQKVSDEDIEILKEAIKLSVSSMGLQPYRVLIIDNPELREKLKPAAFGQSAITDASHLFIFANEVNVGDKQINAYLKNISETRNVSLESLQGFSNSMHGFVDKLSDDAKENWSRKQAYIALATLINTAAFLKIDATPMEGFDANKFNEILELDKHGLNTAVIATIGYRHEQDPAQHYKKVRKSNEELFINL